MALESRFGPGEICFVGCKPSLGLGQIGFVLINNDLIRARIDFRAELARLHFHADAAFKRLDHAGDASDDEETGYAVRTLAKTPGFTAVVVLQLAAEHRVDLGRAVQDYLPGLLPASYPKITVRQLLNHTSGLPEGTLGSGDARGGAGRGRARAAAGGGAVSGAVAGR